MNITAQVLGENFIFVLLGKYYSQARFGED